MSEETKTDAAADPVVQAEKDQAAKGAETVDPLKAVENAALKDQRFDSSFLDSLPAELRSKAEKWNESQKSKAVNEALKSKVEKGEYVTLEQAEAMARRVVKEQAERTQVILDAREQFYSNLAEYGVLPGTPDFEGFQKEFKSGAYNPEAVGRKDVVERIAKNAGVGRFRKGPDLDTRSPYLGTSGVSLKDIQSQKEGKTGTGDKFLDDAMEMLSRQKPKA